MIASISQAKHETLQTVDYVDLDRYLGDWYEIARFDNTFQKGCTATKANYSKKMNGDIKVINECRVGSPSGEVKKATGRSWVNDTNTNSKLKVQFFLNWIRLPIFAGNYWIIELDEENYSYAVVGNPSRKYLWILSRSKDMPEYLYEELVNKAKYHGFDITKLIKTEH